MDFKKYGIVYALVVLVGALFILTRLFPGVRLVNFIPNTGSPSAEASPQSAVKVTIDFGDSQKTYTDIAAPNVYLALVEAAKKDSLEVETTQYDFGILVTQVGTYANTPERAWIYFINGKAGDTAADKKVLLAGDNVEWRYVAPK